MARSPSARGQHCTLKLVPHPQAVVALRTQYRMAGHIQLLANTLIYNGALRCGSKSVEEAVLQLEVPQPFRATCPNWLQQVLLSPPPFSPSLVCLSC